VIYNKPNWAYIPITLGCVIFFLNHFTYLSFNVFDYSYNMKVNIVTGVSQSGILSSKMQKLSINFIQVLAGAGWTAWCLSQIRRRRYVWKMLVFILLATASVVLEIYDFPPILSTFDAHSLWHLSSAPLTILFYKSVQKLF
jgi:post-GPI attachment to proteins factor 3